MSVILTHELQTARTAEPLYRCDHNDFTSGQTTAMEEDMPHDLDTMALIFLGLLQISSSFSYRAAEFAYPLFFVTLFTKTLLPASLYGFLTTGSAIIWSGSVGGLTDKYKTHRLRTARAFIISQKCLVVTSYALFYLLLTVNSLRQDALNGGRGLDSRSSRNPNVWSIFATLALLGSLLILSNVGVSVTIERDWVTSIADGSSRRLTHLNAVLRRVDLTCKLFAPLFVSLLTSIIHYSVTCIILLALSAATLFLELILVGVVYSRFEVLYKEEQQAQIDRTRENASMDTAFPPLSNALQNQGGNKKKAEIAQPFFLWLKVQYNDWREFVVMPIFISKCPR